jgi:hypothetical protein
MKEEKRQGNYLTESVSQRIQSMNLQLRGSFDLGTLRFARLRLLDVRKVSKRHDQPDDHGKPDGRENKPKESFYKFHRAGLHHPVRPFKAYVFSLLRLFISDKVSDCGNGYEQQREQGGRGSEFNKEFHKFRVRESGMKLFREAIKNRGLIETESQN